MICFLHIVRYPKKFAFFGLLSMAVFRLPLIFNKQIHFYKLMGCGQNGSFDLHADWQQWAVLTVSKHQNNGNEHVGKFLTLWWKIFHCEILQIALQPIEGHGTWDGKLCMGKLPSKSNYEGPIAVLTRATLYTKKANRFWQHVNNISIELKHSPGLILSIGLGEIPWYRGATLSIWESKAAMRQFAYSQPFHKEVITKTKKENWYKEDMFVRFVPIKSVGTLRGVDPFQGKL